MSKFSPYLPAYWDAMPVIQSFSLSMAAFSLILIGALFFYKRSMVNRVSLRLQAGIAFIDITNALLALHIYQTPPGIQCTLVGFWRVFGVMIYCYLNIAIAVNLQIIFLQRCEPNPKWEILYWVVPIFVALACCIPPLALDLYGKDTTGICVFKKEHPHSVLLNFVLVALPKFLAVFYCLIIAVLVIIKLNHNIRTIEENAHKPVGKLGDRVELTLFLQKLIFRVSLYPIFCIICLSGSIVLNCLLLANIKPGVVSFWAAVGNESVGIFNCIAILLDPTVLLAIKEAYKSLRANYYPKKPTNMELNRLELDSNNSIQHAPSEMQEITASVLVEETKRY